MQIKNEETKNLPTLCQRLPQKNSCTSASVHGGLRDLVERLGGEERRLMDGSNTFLFHRVKTDVEKRLKRSKILLKDRQE